MKPCIKCGEEKPLDAFYKLSGYEARENVCKRCRDVKRHANRVATRTKVKTECDGFITDPAVWKFLTRAAL